jgi:hypothetical protein
MLRQPAPSRDVPVTSGFGRYCCKSLFEVSNEKFLEPLMRFALGDVRDHVGGSKIDHVVALKSDAAAEMSKDRLSRDF